MLLSLFVSSNTNHTIQFRIRLFIQRGRQRVQTHSVLPSPFGTILGVLIIELHLRDSMVL